MTRTRLLGIVSAFAAMVLALVLATAGVVTAEEPTRPRVRTIAVDPSAGRVLPGVQITFSSARNRGSVSCTTDARGACTITTFPGTRLIVYATSNGERGPSREIMLPASGEVLVYVPVRR